MSFDDHPLERREKMEREQLEYCVLTGKNLLKQMKYLRRKQWTVKKWRKYRYQVMVQIDNELIKRGLTKKYDTRHSV